MPSGFDTWKDVLDVVAVPITVGLLALFWPVIQSFYRCRRFRLLARRELEEMSPFPEEPIDGGSWTAHVKKGLLHKKIVEDASDNRDFLLGLNPDFVYYISQLWAAYQTEDSTQWLYFLDCLSHHRYSFGRKAQISRAAKKWKQLITDYARKSHNQCDRQQGGEPVDSGSLTKDECNQLADTGPK